MIHLTDKHIAVEIPEDACNVQISDNGCFSYRTVINEYRSSYCITSGFNNHYLVGVTPLTKEQWDTIVYKFGKIGYMNYLVKPQFGAYLIKNSIESGISLLKSKGIDPNKKYAIIKIEKDK